MQCEVTIENGYSLITLSGEIDLSTSPRARKIILDSLKENGDVFVDLSGVTYIDSSGIASLVEGYQQAKSGQIRFALIATSEAVMNVLQLARLDKVFPLFDNIDNCLSEN